MTRRNLLRIGSLLLFILLLFLNLYVFLTREWESSFTPSSYATIYYPLDVPTIKEWRVVDRNRLQLDLALIAPVTQWKVLTDGTNPQPASGAAPTFRIDTTFAQLHTYTLIPEPEGVCQNIEISVRFYSAEFYASLGMQRPDVYIVRANVPCGNFEQYSLADAVGKCAPQQVTPSAATPVDPVQGIAPQNAVHRTP